jgi:hypothetical protein
VRAFHFPQPGELQNAAAIPVPEQVLLDLVYATISGASNSRCPGCEACERFRDAGQDAFLLLGPEASQLVVEYAARFGVDLTTWAPVDA